MIKRLLLLTATLFFLYSPLYAVTYYVDSATGNDSWDGKTAAHAWATVAGGNPVNFTQDDQVHIKQTDGTWRVYDAPNQQSQVTAANIIVRARYLLNEETASFWTDAEMLTWVNDGIEDIAARTNCIETTEVDALVAGTLLYDIETEYLKILHAVYRLPTVTFDLLQENGDALLQENDDNILIAQATANGYKGLYRGSYQNVGHEENVSEPIYWFVWKDQVGYYPVTNSSSAGNTVTVYIVARPYEIPSDANIPLPAIYDDPLVVYVAAQGFLKDGMLGFGQAFMAEYQQLLDRFRIDYMDREKDSDDITR